MFDSLTRFTVLIERRATPMLWVLSLLLLLTSAMFASPRASAQPGRHVHAEKRMHKMSPDLKAGIDSAQAALGARAPRPPRSAGDLHRRRR